MLREFNKICFLGYQGCGNAREGERGGRRKKYQGEHKPTGVKFFG